MKIKIIFFTLIIHSFFITKSFSQGCYYPASFSWTNNEGVVNFTNTSQMISSSEWDFGDGNSSTLTNPAHIYSSPGTYTVTLYLTYNWNLGVYGSFSCSSTAYTTLTVNYVPDNPEDYGCTDSSACNYDSTASLDDNSCIYSPNPLYDCDWNCINDIDEDNICDEFDDCIGIWIEDVSTISCSDINNSYTCNSTPGCWYDSCWYLGENCGGCMGGTVEISNNSYCDEIIDGCTEQNACNYNSLANTDDDSCEYVSCIDCNGIIFGNTILDECGICGGDNSSCSGCTDESAINYDESAIIDNGSCNFITSHEINLQQGWSIMSTHLQPENSDIVAVFEEIEDNLAIVKDESGFVYWPTFALNNIYELSVGKGYQVKMNSPEDLLVTGTQVPYDTPLELNGGWNIMGYLHNQQHNAAEMMSSMYNNLIIMKDELGNVYWPTYNLNNIGNMQPGEGYQIKLAGPYTFSYPSGDEGARYGDIYTERPIHFDEPVNTGSNMIIGFPQYAWESTLSIGDEIAAYDEEGRLIGSTVYEGSNLALTVWGDDMTTDEKDGLIESERIIFRLWNSTNSTEQVLDIKWEEGSGIYSTDGISVAGQIILGNEVTSKRQLVKITDVLGKEVNGNEKDVMLLYIYDDSSIERVFIKE